MHKICYLLLTLDVVNGLCSTLCSNVDSTLCAMSSWICVDYVEIVGELTLTKSALKTSENAYEAAYSKLTWTQNILADTQTQNQSDVPPCVFDAENECSVFVAQYIERSLPLIRVPPCAVVEKPTREAITRSRIQFVLAFFIIDVLVSWLRLLY